MDISIYSQSLLCTYFKFWQWLLAAHKYSCSLQECSLCRMARAIYMNQTSYEQIGLLARLRQSRQFYWNFINRLWIFSMQHILSHHWWLFLPSAAQSSSDVTDVSAVDSTPLGDCGYRYLTFVVYAFYFSIWLWILSIYDKRVKEWTDKCVF